MCIYYFVRRDSVNEGKEWAALSSIRRERGKDRHTHLLGNVVRRRERPSGAAEAGTTVTNSQRADGSQHVVERHPVAAHRRGQVRVELRIRRITHRCSLAPKCHNRSASGVSSGRPH
jgi:hypothetical protein